MRCLSAVICFLLVCGGLLAQKPVWQPSPGHSQVPIWPGAVPDPQPTSGPESRRGHAEGISTKHRQAGDGHQQRHAADDDGLLAQGKQHRRSGRRVSGWRLPEPGHRSRRDRRLRLAGSARDHLCALEVPDHQHRTLPEVRTLPRVAHGSGRRAKNGRPGPLPCGRACTSIRTRSASWVSRRVVISWRRSARTVHGSHLPGSWTQPTR